VTGSGRLSAVVGFWQNPFNRFVMLFLLYLGVVSYLFPKLRFGVPEVMEVTSEFAALVVYWMLLPFSSNLLHIDAIVSLGNFSVSVIDECTGIYEILIYMAAVFAYPTGLRDKGLGLLMGIPLLYAMNILRILMLLVVGSLFPTSFEFMHIYFWQATLVIMVSAVWLAWVFFIVQNGATHTPDHA